MRVCIPTESDRGESARVFDHFGSAPFFTIYDTDSAEVEVVSNANQHHSHGMCQPMAALAGHNVDVVVTGGAGLRAIQKLNEGGVRVFRAVPGTVMDIVDRLTRGLLEEMTVSGACRQHDCHGHH